MNAPNIWNVSHVVLASGAPKFPTPKKIVPLFRQNLGVKVKNFECAIRVPPRPVRDKIVKLYLGPLSGETVFKFLLKTHFFELQEF